LIATFVFELLLLFCVILLLLFKLLLLYADRLFILDDCDNDGVIPLLNDDCGNDLLFIDDPKAGGPMRDCGVWGYEPVFIPIICFESFVNNGTASLKFPNVDSIARSPSDALS